MKLFLALLILIKSQLVFSYEKDLRVSDLKISDKIIINDDIFVSKFMQFGTFKRYDPFLGPFCSLSYDIYTMEKDYLKIPSGEVFTISEIELTTGFFNKFIKIWTDEGISVRCLVLSKWYQSRLKLSKIERFFDGVISFELERK